MKYIAVLFLVLLAGCETESQVRQRIAAEQSWQVCLDKGGVPIGSWYSHTILSDCKL